MSINYREPLRKIFESSDQALLVFTFVLSLTISIVVTYQREKSLVDLFESRFVNSASDLTRQLGLPLKINNIIGINDLLNKSFLMEESSFVQILDANNQLLYNSPIEVVSLCQGTLKSAPVHFQNEYVGTLRYCFNQPNEGSWQAILIGLSGFLIGWLLLFILIGMWYRRRTHAFDEFFKFVDRFNLMAEVTELPEFHDSKIKIAADKIIELAGRFKIKQEEVTKLEKDQEYARLASQVSHDIRSPLAALKMLLTQLDSIPEDKRILIRSSVNRINDISNDLLNHGKKISNDNITAVSNLENAMLATLVDSVVSEKRISLRDKANISLEARLDKSYGLFSLINSVEMKRLLSNTITNAAEAFNLNQGFVEVILESIGDKVILTIKDNGKGIPSHILEKLGLHGVTHGKEGTQSGSGLGVYHAKKTIESFGGKYEIKSKVGHGTSIIITLKKENPPDWFVQKLMIKKNQTIVATDDDSSILEIWKQKFSGFIEHNSIQLVTCTSGKCLKEWILNNKESSIDAIYLMDFELLGQKQTGLDLIDELLLNQRAILVSSRYEESQIKDRCLKLGVKMIPKGMASLVPIELEQKKQKLDCILFDSEIVNKPIILETDSPEASPSKIKYDLCLIDDDRELIHFLWGTMAKSRGLKIIMFSTPSEFYAASNTIDKQTPIFVDVSLGSSGSGIDFSHKINKLGFNEINLATGYPADSIEVPSFIRQVVGKDFPI